LIVGGNDAVKKIALQLQLNGFDVRPILNPTVQKGKERLRICIHSFNTGKEIKELCSLLNEYFENKK
jgi:8-amino-7-oxononanoate synthase